jgi:hypothetical protein
MVSSDNAAAADWELADDGEADPMPDEPERDDWP